MATALWTLALLAAALPAAAAELVTPQTTPRSDDPPRWNTLRDRLFDEARPDFLRLEYERLFGEPWHDEGWHPFARFKPFEDTRKLDEAVDRYYFNRMDAGVKQEPARVSLVVRAPGTAEQHLKVWINEDRVLLSFQPDESSEPKWHYVRPTEQSLPLPAGADSKTASIERDGDVVTVSFEKKLQ